MNNVMLDLETMGTAFNSPIVAIGAVRFDPKSEAIGETFYQLIDLQSCVDAGLPLDASTVIWWMRQGDSARGQICNPSLERSSIKDALFDFALWLQPEDKVWGNGVDFDNVILANAYKSVLKTEQPWKFWNNRCYRTVKNLKPNIELVREGTHHNCLDDAISQAKHLQIILGGRK